MITRTFYRTLDTSNCVIFVAFEATGLLLLGACAYLQHSCLRLALLLHHNQRIARLARAADGGRRLSSFLLELILSSRIAVRRRAPAHALLIHFRIKVASGSAFNGYLDGHGRDVELLSKSTRRRALLAHKVVWRN